MLPQISESRIPLTFGIDMLEKDSSNLIVEGPLGGGRTNTDIR